MNAFLQGVALQFKLDLRNKSVFLTYYTIPLVFFIFMGGIFSSINPEAKDTLIQSMTVFAVTMGAILGSPVPLVELYGSEIKKAFKVGRIPLWASAVNNFISAFVHLFIVNLVIFFVAPIAFDAAKPADAPLYFASVALFIAVCISVGTVLGLFVKATSKLTMFSQLIFLPSLMLSGIMFPTNLLPDILATIGKVFPATWGFALMTSGAFEMAALLPLALILLVAVGLSVFRLSKMGVE